MLRVLLRLCHFPSSFVASNACAPFLVILAHACALLVVAHMLYFRLFTSCRNASSKYT